jgi:hypothetical protein
MTASALEGHVNKVLDLHRLPPGDYWDHIMAAVRQLDAQSRDAWQIKVHIGDGPEVAVELPHLVGYLNRMDIRHEVIREPTGTQGLLLTRHI